MHLNWEIPIYIYVHKLSSINQKCSCCSVFVDSLEVKMSESGRSSLSQMFFKIGFLKNFAIFTGKHLGWSLFFINFMKRRLQHRCFPVNITKFLRKASFYGTPLIAASDFSTDLKELFHFSDAAFRRCSLRQMFLKISQYSKALVLGVADPQA